MAQCGWNECASFSGVLAVDGRDIGERVRLFFASDAREGWRKAACYNLRRENIKDYQHIGATAPFAARLRLR